MTFGDYLVTGAWTTAATLLFYVVGYTWYLVIFTGIAWMAGDVILSILFVLLGALCLRAAVSYLKTVRVLRNLDKAFSAREKATTKAPEKTMVYDA